MLYVIILALLGALAWREYRHDTWRQAAEEAASRERTAWAKERQNLLDRIQAPHAAQVAATEALTGATAEQPTEMERLHRKAEAMGLSVDDLRTLPGWGNVGW